jgi:hypothetical protein
MLLDRLFVEAFGPVGDFELVDMFDIDRKYRFPESDIRGAGADSQRSPADAAISLASELLLRGGRSQKSDQQISIGLLNCVSGYPQITKTDLIKSSGRGQKYELTERISVASGQTISTSVSREETNRFTSRSEMGLRFL